MKMNFKPEPISLPDVMAGLSIAGLLLPEAVAYSGIGNMPPQAGVWALFAGLLMYGLFGSSRFAIVSATSSSAVVLASVTSAMSQGSPELALMLASGVVILIGLFFVLGSIFKLGHISDFIAKPILTGFTFGLAVVISCKQLPKILGLQVQHSDVFHIVNGLIVQFVSWNKVGLLLGVTGLLLLFLLQHFRRIPAALVLIVIGIGLGSSGWLEPYSISLVGNIHLDLSNPVLPELQKEQWLRLGEVAAAMALVLYAESYGAICSMAIKHADTISPNRDLLAFGFSNILSGLFNGMPVGAGYSGTSANEAAGAVSKWAGLVCLLVIFFVVLLLLPALAYIPEPFLAAIVIHAVSNALKPAALRPYFVLRRDRVVLLASIFGVLALGVLDGLLIAIGVSIMMTLRRLTHAQVDELGRMNDGHDFVSLKDHPEAVKTPKVLILRPETPLFFANAERVLFLVRQQCLQSPSVRVLLVSLEESPDLDATSIDALCALAAQLQQAGQRLLLARLKKPAKEVLLRASVSHFNAESLCEWSVDDAVQIANNWIKQLDESADPCV